MGAADYRRLEAAPLGRSELAQKVAVAAAGVLALMGLTARVFPAAAPGWAGPSSICSVAGLACALGLGLSFQPRSRNVRMAIRLLALVTAAPILARTAGELHWAPALRLAEAAPPALVGAALVFLGMILWLLDSREGTAAVVADTAVLGLGWSILTLLAEAVFRGMRLYQLEQPAVVQPALLWMLALLALAAVARRLDHGLFAILLGDGMSGRIIGRLLPLVLFLPFFRELFRARLIASRRVPEHAVTAIMASTAAVVSVAILLVIGYYFRRMENEVRELTLRDELTGLYNLRGFRLLADHALRLAQRSKLPFSVLYVDVDELKSINDVLGHAAGSEQLRETAELLRSHFRETDVVGRIGGDEFAVAGQFDGGAMKEAVARMAAAAESARDGQTVRPSLSIGYVSADPHRKESLEDLLALADAAMYQQKRSKKQQQVSI